MNETSSTSVLTGKSLDLLLARLITKALLALAAVTIVAVIQALRLGLDWRYILLIAGSIISGALIFAYPVRVVRDYGKPNRGLMSSIVALGGFVPYLFGCYLVFYEGFWRLRLLGDGFSFSVIGVSLLFLVAGFLVVSGIHKATEFGRAVTEGRIQIA